MSDCAHNEPESVCFVYMQIDMFLIVNMFLCVCDCTCVFGGYFYVCVLVSLACCIATCCDLIQGCVFTSCRNIVCGLLRGNQVLLLCLFFLLEACEGGDEVLGIYLWETPSH